MSEKQILTLDSQILNTYQMCARKCKYAFVDKIAPLQKAEALDKGGLLHELLKVHYIVEMKNYERLLKLSTFELPMKKEDFLNPAEGWDYERDYVEASLNELKAESQHNLVKKHYEYCMSNTDLPVQICEEVWRTYLEYAEYYNNDGWIPIAVENPFSKILHEDDNIQILYEGITDLVTEKLVIDHKSSSRRGEPLSLSNQFKGYAWALGINNVVINKVGFQKTLEPKDKFERYTKSYPTDLIAEWVQNTISECFKLFRHLNDLDNMESTFNQTSCDKYSGCTYIPICETEREARSWKKQNNYKIGPDWNPAGDLEKNG